MLSDYGNGVEVDRCVMRLRERFYPRDEHMEEIRAVRRGEIDQLHPVLFSDEMNKSIVANLIDVVARDLAEVMAPLPNLACTSGNMTSESDRRRSALKNKIGSYYLEHSRLQTQMFKFADQYNSYGFSVFVIEPDHEQYCPSIRVEDALRCWYALDRWGNVIEFAKEWEATAGELASLFPEHAEVILTDNQGRSVYETTNVRLIRYMDRHKFVLYMPDRVKTVLEVVPNRLSRVPIAIVERFGLETVPRGQFDDVIWVQLARSIMALYQLQAADKSINAPIALPEDVTELNTGADATIRTASPQNVRRVDLNVPRDTWQLSGQLDQEAKEGARYPDARTGGIKGSIITGRGVEAMLGTFDTQIKTAQSLFSQAIERAVSICFEMDVTYWPNRRKTVEGTISGKSYQAAYTPSKDIAQQWGCKVTYGFAAGLTPAQAIVTLLQLRGDKLIQRDTFRRALPFDIDPDEEQRGLDVEDLEEGLKQAVLAYVQALGPMVAQGQDAMTIVKSVATAIEQRAKGKSLHEAVLLAFTPPEPEPGAELGAELGPPGLPGEGELPPGVRPGGLPQGVAYGQAGLPPGGMPSVMSLISEMKGDRPNLQAGVLRRIPTG